MWRLRLGASDNAIETLSGELPDLSSGVVFTKSGEHWLLQTPASSEEPNAKSALDAGNQVVDRLNFAVSLRDPHHEPVARSTTVVDEQNHSHHFIEARSFMSFSSTASGITTTRGAPAMTRQRTRGELILNLGGLAPEVDEVARIWNRERDPVNLYKIFEIVKDHGRGRPCGIDDLHSRPSVRRFTHSMNHPRGTGDRARHARLSSTPPPDPMSEPEAVRFIAQLIDEWLECLAGVHGLPTEVRVQNP